MGRHVLLAVAVGLALTVIGGFIGYSMGYANGVATTGTAAMPYGPWRWGVFPWFFPLGFLFPLFLILSFVFLGRLVFWGRWRYGGPYWHEHCHHHGGLHDKPADEAKGSRTSA